MSDSEDEFVDAEATLTSDSDNDSEVHDEALSKNFEDLLSPKLYLKKTVVYLITLLIVRLLILLIQTPNISPFNSFAYA